MARRKTQLGAGAGRHRKITVDLPRWLDDAEPCMRSVGEDAYYARALAEARGADRDPSCGELMRAARKSLETFENAKAKAGVRCAAGDRAARKFWEAKVCARTGTR